MGSAGSAANISHQKNSGTVRRCAINAGRRYLRHNGITRGGSEWAHVTAGGDA
jgi:hypothetical protein